MLVAPWSSVLSELSHTMQFQYCRVSAGVCLYFATERVFHYSNAKVSRRSEWMHPLEL